MTVSLVRVVLSDGLIHVARPTAPQALCDAPRRAPGDRAADDAAVSCRACVVRAIQLERGTGPPWLA